MRNVVSYSLGLILFLFSHPVLADAFVCQDANGKKIFSSGPCEKRGLKTASRDFPVITGQAIRAVVISPPPSHAPDASGAQIMMKRDLNLLDRPVLFFLVAMMLATCVLFGLLFVRFFKAHHRKYHVEEA